MKFSAYAEIEKNPPIAAEISHCKVIFHPPERWISLKKTIAFAIVFFWRRRGDSNSRAGYPTYALSRGASSPT